MKTRLPKDLNMTVRIGDFRQQLNELAELKGWKPHKIMRVAIIEYLNREIEKQKFLKEIENALDKEIYKEK